VNSFSLDQRTERALVGSLESNFLLMDRVERLMTIPAVGPITALTWALESGDVQRFSSIKKAVEASNGIGCVERDGEQADFFDAWPARSCR
jgi:transposase